MDTTTDLEFLYVGDPMCSWCWGFAPVVEELTTRYRIPLRVVVGGLRPGPNAEPLTGEMRGFLAHHWEQVAERSGQPFDHRGLDREGWVYDTELPARAVVTMREMSPGDTVRFFTASQQAFYADRVDITDPAVYPALVAPYDVDGEKFMERLHDEQSRLAAWEDFDEARQLGVAGFPGLLLRTEDGYVVVTRGYLPFDQLEPAVTGWLGRTYPDQVEGLVCAIDGDC